MLAVEDLGLWRPGSGTALEGVTFSVEEGEAVLLAGRNGAGGSSVLSCIAGRSRPGERRVGRICLGAVDLSFAHPDDIATAVMLLDDTALPRPTTVQDVVLVRRPTGRADPQVVEEVVERLGLTPLVDARIGELTSSQRVRARFAGALVQRPRVLLLDQMLAPLEARWKQVACALVRAFVRSGGLVVWADQDLPNALTAVDRVVELDGEEGGRGSERASAWRPRRLPWTPLQEVASVLGAEGPEGNTVEGLRRFAPDLSSATELVRRPVRVRGSVVAVPIDDQHEVLVDDTAPPVFLCDTTQSARACRALLARTHRAPQVPLHRQMTVRQVAQRMDRPSRMRRGTTLATLAEAVPSARPDARWTAHSSGEQVRIRNALALSWPATRLLYEPFRYLDRAALADLIEQVHAAWLTGRSVLVVTTDVEAAVAFGRVIVWSEEGIEADARPEAILHRLPAVPLVAQLCSPRPVVDTSGLLDGLRRWSA